MDKFINEFDNDKQTSARVSKDTELMILNNQDKQ